MFHISSPIVFFLWEGQRWFFGGRWGSNFIWGGQKEGVRGGMVGEAKMRWFFAKFPWILSRIQTLSHKLLVRQTSLHHHCDWHAQKPNCNDFQVISSSSSWSKTALCILRNKYGFQIGMLWKNKIYFNQEEMLKMAWNSMHVGFWRCQFQWHRFWGCTLRCFQVMGYMHAFSWKLLITGLFWNILQHYSKYYTWRK